jgi:serine/threonine protein kinase
MACSEQEISIRAIARIVYAHGGALNVPDFVEHLTKIDGYADAVRWWTETSLEKETKELSTDTFWYQCTKCLCGANRCTNESEARKIISCLKCSEDTEHVNIRLKARFKNGIKFEPAAAARKSPERRTLSPIEREKSFQEVFKTLDTEVDTSEITEMKKFEDAFASTSRRGVCSDKTRILLADGTAIARHFTIRNKHYPLILANDDLRKNIDEFGILKECDCNINTISTMKLKGSLGVGVSGNVFSMGETNGIRYAAKTQLEDRFVLDDGVLNGDQFCINLYIEYVRGNKIASIVKDDIVKNVCFFGVIFKSPIEYTDDTGRKRSPTFSVMLFLVMEKIPGGSAYSLFEKTESLLPRSAFGRMKVAKNIAYTVAKTLANIHKNGFVHGDIKNQNILLRRTISGFGAVSVETVAKTAVLCDFGLSSDKPVGTWMIMSPDYRAPEVHMIDDEHKIPWTSAVDIWGLGCSLLEILGNGHYFIDPICGMGSMYVGKKTPSARDYLDRIGMFFGPYKESDIKNPKYKDLVAKAYPRPSPLEAHYSSDEGANTPQIYAFIGLIKEMLKINPSERITAEKILEHSIFKDVQGSGKNTSYF